MVEAQHALLTDHLGIDHLRLVMGNSMGGMLTWTWGIEYPDFMDALVPMASLPGPMSGRNWMMRRMLIDSVRNDPEWNGGDYTEQPPALRLANVWFSVATSNGEKRLAKIGNTREAADAYLDKRLAEGTAPDANDAMYQWNASRDFDPVPDLGKIEAALLVINSEDDERNPPELDTLANGMAAIGHGEVYIIPRDRGDLRPRHDRQHGRALRRATGRVPRSRAEAVGFPRKGKAHPSGRALPTLRFRERQCRAVASNGASAPERSTSPSGPAVTVTVEPSSTSPASIFSASGSCTAFWITRLSGRAP